MPTVWFAAEARSEAFDQFAAVVRRSGCRVVRLFPAGTSRWHRLLARLIYHRVVQIDALQRGRNGPRADERVVDLQWTEKMSEEVHSQALDRFPRDLVARLERRRAWSNKSLVSALLIEQGIPVAPQLAAREVGDEAAIEAFGLPLVVKGEIGAGGDAVRFAHTAAEVSLAVTGLDPTRERVFFQPLLTDEVRNYCGVIGPDGRVLEDVVLRQRGQAGTVRPGREVVADPALLDYGRRVCAALGVTGPVDLEAISDGEQPLLIDLNARPWYSMTSMRMVGFDFASHYLTALGIVARPPRGLRGGVAFAVFPVEIEQLLGAHRFGAAVWVMLRRLPPFARWGGVRLPAYVVALRVLRRATRSM